MVPLNRGIAVMSGMEGGIAAARQTRRTSPLKVIVRIRMARVKRFSRVGRIRASDGQTFPRCGWGDFYSIEHFELGWPDGGGAEEGAGRWRRGVHVCHKTSLSHSKNDSPHANARMAQTTAQTETKIQVTETEVEAKASNHHNAPKAGTAPMNAPSRA